MFVLLRLDGARNRGMVTDPGLDVRESGKFPIRSNGKGSVVPAEEQDVDEDGDRVGQRKDRGLAKQFAHRIGEDLQGRVQPDERLEIDGNRLLFDDVVINVALSR